MTIVEDWERAKTEDELRYFSRHFLEHGAPLPPEQIAIIRGPGGKPIRIAFLLVASPYGLAYETLERLFFIPDGSLEARECRGQGGEEKPTYWTVLL